MNATPGFHYIFKKSQLKSKNMKATRLEKKYYYYMLHRFRKLSNKYGTLKS